MIGERAIIPKQIPINASFDKITHLNKEFSMESMANWEIILTGILVVLLMFWMGPGIKETLRRSKEAEDKDWKAVLIPLALVVLFVMFLISMV